MKKALLIILVAVMAAVAVLPVAAERSVSVMTLSGVTGLAMAKMMEQPVKSEAGYKFQVFKSPDVLLAKLISGEADIAALPTNTAAILYNKGVKLQLASIIGWGVMYIVGNDQTITKWEKLKGKEIYVPGKGAVPDILLRYLLIKNGVNPDTDLKINYLASPAELAQLTIAGKAQLAALPEPWVTEVIEKSPQAKVLLDFQKEWGRIEKQGSVYPQSCVVVSQKFAQEQPEELKLFLRELKGSIKWLNAHPEQGGELAEKYLQISRTAVVKGLRRCNIRYNDAVQVSDQVRRFLEVLGQTVPEATGGKLPDEAIFYRP